MGLRGARSATQRCGCHLPQIRLSVTRAPPHRRLHRPRRQLACRSAEVRRSVALASAAFPLGAQATCPANATCSAGVIFELVLGECTQLRCVLQAQQQSQRQQQAPSRQTSHGKSRNGSQQLSVNGSHSASASTASVSSIDSASNIVLYYYTGWSQAKLHCSVNAGAWQDRNFEQVVLGCIPTQAPYLRPD